MTSRRVLVTGSAGFLGSQVMRSLSSSGFDAHGTIRTGSAPAADGDFHEVDLNDGPRINRLLADLRPAAVINSAVSHVPASGPQRGRDDADDSIRTAEALVDACVKQGVPRLVHVSSSTVYAASDRPLRESDPTIPFTDRGRHKLLAEHAVLAAAERIDVAVLRPFRIYGPGERPDRLLPRILEVLRTDGELAVPSRPTVRDYVHVDDVARACVLAVDRGPSGSVVNIGSGSQTSVLELVELIETLTGRRIRLADAPFPMTSIDVPQWCADIRAAGRILDWRPEIRLREGLARLLRDVGVPVG